MGLIEWALGEIAKAIGVGLFKDELMARMPRICTLILNIAVRRLPADKQDRFKEEWTRHLEDTVGPVSKLLQSAHFLVASLKISPLKFQNRSKFVSPESKIDQRSEPALTMRSITPEGREIAYDVPLGVLKDLVYDDLSRIKYNDLYHFVYTCESDRFQTWREELRQVLQVAPCDRPADFDDDDKNGRQ